MNKKESRFVSNPRPVGNILLTNMMITCIMQNYTHHNKNLQAHLYANGTSKLVCKWDNDLHVEGNKDDEPMHTHSSRELQIS